MAKVSKDRRIAQLEAEVANIRGAWRNALEARDEAIALANRSCPCRCHTGTCGENDMVLAERAVRLISRLSAVTPDAVEAIDYMVQRAGVNFARAAVERAPDDDEMPF